MLQTSSKIQYNTTVPNISICVIISSKTLLKIMSLIYNMHEAWMVSIEMVILDSDLDYSDGDDYVVLSKLLGHFKKKDRSGQSSTLTSVV